MPTGIRRAGGDGATRGTALPAPLGARPAGGRGARIKRSIVFIHADRDEHVDADTAAQLGIVLKGSPEWIRFDSKREAKRFVALRNEQKAGQIRNLQRQVKFALQVRRPDMLMVTIATWTADFTYERKEIVPDAGALWKRVVEDCKGMRTEIYQRSKKHFEAQHGITITET